MPPPFEAAPRRLSAEEGGASSDRTVVVGKAWPRGGSLAQRAPAFSCHARRSEFGLGRGVRLRGGSLSERRKQEALTGTLLATVLLHERDCGSPEKAWTVAAKKIFPGSSES